MHRIILSFLTVVAAFSVSATQYPAMSVKVSGVVNGISSGASRSLIINECDICDKSKRCFVELDSVGRFDVELPFYYGHTFTVNYNRRLFINAYAEPGDSIFVSIDADKSPVEFHLAGDHALLNEEYSHAFCDLAPIYHDVALAPDSVPLSVYMPQFKKEVARTKALVDKYIADRNLLPETAELLYLDNTFTPANLAIGFTGKSIDERIAFFTDPMFDISNERNVRVMIFPYHLSALMRKDPEYVKKMPKSMIRDLMYATRKGGGKPSRNDFVNPAYYDRLYAETKSAVDFSGLNPGRIVVMENDTLCNIDRVNPIEWLKSRFPSHPVYIDVSATWCGPCRAALSYSNDLRQHFKDSDIIFAIIWLKSDIESWKALAPGINNAIHIFIPDDDMSNNIMGTLNLHGFPSYYLIERNGEITTENIPHFNDPDLADYLRSKQ